MTLLRFRHQGQLRQTNLGIRDHSLQQTLVVAQHPADGGGVEAAAIVGAQNRHRRVACGLYGQGIVRASFDASELADLDLSIPALQRDVAQPVLEREHGVEQPRPSRPLAPPLDLDERAVLVLAHLDLLVPQPPQPLQQPTVGLHSHSRRQRVHEEPDDGVRSRQVHLPSRHDAPEQNVLLAAVPAEEDGPGALKHRVERHLITARQRLQRVARRDGQPQPFLFAATAGPRRDR